MESDLQKIQGLWRVVSTVARGRNVLSETTHYQFEGDKVREIVPSMVAGPDRTTFTLDPSARPKRIVQTTEWAGKRGDTVQRVDRWLYELDGDSLRLCWPNVFGDFPDQLSDQKHGVITLKRDSGPPPETKRPSGKAPLQDPVLGRLTWDDNLDWWEAELEWQPGRSVSLHITPTEEETEAATLARAQAWWAWIRGQEASARAFAAGGLLETHNDHWNDEEPISAETFAGRLVLEGVEIGSENDLDLYYADGDLFWGHCVIVSITAAREFSDTQIAG